MDLGENFAQKFDSFFVSNYADKHFLRVLNIFIWVFKGETFQK